MANSAAPNLGRNRGNAGKGRPKGAKNKTTAAVKNALTKAFDQLGGVPSLVKWGKENQTEFYKLWAKLLPQEISGPDGEAIPINALLVLPPEQ
jgi:hypothetical protein